MIINPSAHTMIPRRNAFRRHTARRRREALSLPGGKQLWLSVTKVLLVSFLFLFIGSSLLSGTATRVAAEIDALEMSHAELVSTNVLLRAKKAQLFSPKAVEVTAGNQLAIHIPASGQYRKF